VTNGIREPGFGSRGGDTSRGDWEAAGEPATRNPSPEFRPTTDPQDELFDVLDEDGQPTGVVKRRGDVHRDGDWHGAIHIWVGGIGDDGTPFVIFQRRSLTKDTWGGYLDTTVGGHIRSGETLADAAREAEEEIGLNVGLADLAPIGRHRIIGGDGKVAEREIHTVYAVRCDQPLDAYRLHPDEVSALVAIPIDAAIELFSDTVDRVIARECPRSGTPAAVELRRSDFIAGGRPDYVLATLAALGAVIAGRTPEPFDVRTVMVTA
jgi:isopentenyldiphosphate isomerase